MILTFLAHMRLRTPGHEPINLAMPVAIDTPDDNRPLADNEAAERAAIERLRPFLHRETRITCSAVVEVQPPKPTAVVTRTDDDVIAAQTKERR